MNSNEIRQSFLDFFKSKGHYIVPSSSLLPEAPNLLFTNAGMNPFVPYFLGERKPTYLRISDTQKCIRAGGKHNDLEEVGFDTYHHTFFEMLGNWSMGDYFKKEAIEWAWELLTKVWKLPKERLYATVYQPQVGDPAEFDHEAYDFWKAIFIQEGLDPKVHIVTGNKRDNFWMMGDTGPCGPCSEIHIDLTSRGDTQGVLVNKGDVRCIEIWNLVFMQYNAFANGQFELLKNKYVDTGMGFERVAGIFATTKNFTDFSKIPSNYDSDLFAPIFHWLQQRSGHVYQGQVADASQQNVPPEVMADCAFRIIADHIRTLSFAIADGILPGNEGRNYVLRRIVRRAALFGKKLNLPAGFFSELSSVVVEQMGDLFPELRQNKGTIAKVLRKEEESFNLTLERGLRLFEHWLQGGMSVLLGDRAFLLYDTYGFPLDLTQIIAQEHAISVDIQGFQEKMDLQKERSKAAMKKSTVMLAESDVSTTFVGYNEKNLTAWLSEIIAIHEQNGIVYIATESSPFYGEKGGQIGDTGTIILPDASVFEITNTIWQGNTMLHAVHGLNIESASKFLRQKVQLSVNIKRRVTISRNHSATHLLHWALRKVIGNHVHQAGSFVSDKSLRFDFSHFEKISRDQLQEIEKLCNEKILENAAVFTEEVDFDKRPKECLAFFEDKYGDRVRVVHIGDFSLELCGGTHVNALGELGQLKILQESSVASGVRRIEAVVGMEAFAHHQILDNTRYNLERQFECSLDKIFDKYQQLLKQKKESDALYRKSLQQSSNSAILQDQILQDLHCVKLRIQTTDLNNLRSLGKSYFSQNAVDVLWTACEFEGKGMVLVFCSQKAISKGYEAHALLRSFMQQLGVNGGGKPDFASGGIKDVAPLKLHWESLSLI